MRDDYGPMAEMIAANQESIVRVLREALTLIERAVGAGRTDLVHAIVVAASTYHPMHEESWSGFPSIQEQVT